MANAEYPPLGKTYVISYSNGDKDFPILAIKKDPRVDNYRRPDDLSPHPDSTRYPNHVFTGTQPTNTDERVIWIYEIIPSPWIPFTRYDDDLGPVQGRRRSVANTGQQATLERDKRVTYEAREGSAIVSTELEETWDAGSTDPDETSPFPIKVRDFYDERLGAIQESRQLVTANGDEAGSLTYSDPTITQISYEPYNEYLLFKIVRTFNLPCPQRYDEIYDDARGAIQRISQVIYDDKTLQASITESNGTVTQTIYQSVNELLVDKIVETLSTTGPLRSGGQTGQWGLESSSRQTVDAGTLPSYGFGVKASAITPINSEHSEKQIENYPEDSDNDGVVYTLKGQEQDETTKAIVSVEKSLVEAETLESGRVANYISGLRSNGYIVEVQPVDKWHSITIASKITGAPQNESWTETGSIDLPNVLQEVGVYWDSDTEESADAAGVNNISQIIEEEYRWQIVASGTISGRVVGSPYVKVKAGYRGSARMSVSRTFHFGAPSDVINIHKFEPVYGTINIFGQSAVIKKQSYANGVGDIKIASGIGTTFNSDTSIVSDQFGPIEWTGSVVIQDKGDQKTITDSVNASGGSIPGGGIYPSITATISLTGSATLELPTSSTPKTSGSTFVRQVDVKPWRLGWWVREVYTAVVP